MKTQKSEPKQDWKKTARQFNHYAGSIVEVVGFGSVLGGA